MLSDLVPAEGRQTDLFATSTKPAKAGRLMNVLDEVNRKMGRETLVLASQGFSKPWRMKQGNKSPGYISNWDEMMVAF